jgi:hypothetical protein
MGTRPHSGSQCGPAAPSRDVHGKHRTGGCPFCVLLILVDQGTDHPPRLDRVGDHPSTTVQAEPAQRRPVSPWRSTSRHARLAASMLAIRRRREPRLGLTSTAMQAIAPTTRSGQARYAAVRPQRRWPAATRAASTRPRMSLTSTLAAIEGRRRSCSETPARPGAAPGAGRTTERRAGNGWHPLAGLARRSEQPCSQRPPPSTRVTGS